jgi:hypothetical protein
MSFRTRYLTSLIVAAAALLYSNATAIAFAARPPLNTLSPSPSLALAPAPTVTSVSTSANPATFTPPSTSATVTFTAVVVSPAGIVNEGAVTFVDGTTTLGSVAVTSGQAVFGASLAEGTHAITATYKDSGTAFEGSSTSLNERVNSATQNPIAASEGGPYSYCNIGPITVPAPGFESGAASPYPSNIFVTNLPGTVNAVTVTLRNFSTKDQGDFLSLLVGPGGNNLDLFSLTGSSVTSAPSPFNLTFSDTAASLVTENLSSAGTFKPTSFNTSIGYPQCSSNVSQCTAPPVGPPLPTNPFTPTNKAATAGTSLLGNAFAAGVFGGTSSSTYDGNGTWSLYLDDGGPTGLGQSSSLSGGWCVNITTNLPSISAVKSHSSTFTQGEPNVPFTVNITNNGPGSTGDPTNGSIPLTVTDILNSAFSYAGFSGTAWNCSAVGQTVTCTNDSAVAQSSSYAPLTIAVNVSPTAGTTTAIPNQVTVTGGGAAPVNSNTDSVTILPAATLALQKTHSGNFTQGGTAQWNITVSNTASGGLTYGTVSVSDTLPTGYTLASYASTSTAWTCSGTTTVACTTTEGIAGGASSVINLTVNVPASSPASVTNTALAWGGGDPVHTSLATAASASDTATVVSTKPPATVVSYNALFGSQSFNLIGSTRVRLPWEITGIQVVFSQPISAANVNSLAGVTTTGFSGLGTNTLTWTISPVAIGSFSTTLVATGANAIKDVNGNALNGGTNFTQNLKVLWGDFNDDGVVDASDAVLVNAARSAPYNIFADMSGDGVVNATDVAIVRSRIGTSQP